MVQAELDQLARHADKFIADTLPDVFRAGAGASGFGVRFDAVSRRSLERIQRDSFDDVLALTTHTTGDTKRWIRETSRRLAEEGHIEGLTSKQMADRFKNLGPRAATIDGIPNPITAVRYRNGATHTLDTYSEMLFRTKTAVAYNEGTIRNGQAWGITRYEGLDGAGCRLVGHGGDGWGPEVNGLVFTAEQALQNPIGHPNCVRAWVPRPDLDPAGSDVWDVGRDVGAFEPSTTAAQRLAQDSADAQRNAANANRAQRKQRIDGRTRRVQARTERAAADAAAKAAAAARQAALEEAARAKEAAAAAARARSARNASRQAARRGTERRHGDLLDRHGITADQYNSAVRQLAEIKAQLRADAADLAHDVWLRMPQREIKRPPKKVRTTDPNTGRVRFVRPDGGRAGEYDFMEHLDDGEVKMVRRWMSKGQGGGPDELVAAYQPRTAGTLQLEDAVELWLDDVRRIESARSVAAGRPPRFMDGNDLFLAGGQGSPTAQSLILDLDIDLNILLQSGADGKADAAAHLARRQLEELVRRVDKDGLLAQVTDAPPAYRLTAEQYADEVAHYLDPDVVAVVDRAAAGGPLTPAEKALVDRFGELVPPGFETDAEDIAGTYEAIMHLATQAGLL
jgi:hypothetical protein